MNKKIILFDLDGTLLNSEKLGQNFYNEIAKFSGKSFEEIVALKDKYKSDLDHYTDFHPNDLAKFIAKKLDLDADKVAEIINQEKNYQDLPFEETFAVLEKLSQDNILGLYTEGFTDFQTRKLDVSGIYSFFEEKFVFMARRKTTDEILEKIPTEVMIVDDKKEVIQVLRHKRPDIEVVWINRKNDEEMEGVRTIHNLNELL